MRLVGRNALVTGGASGLGRAIAERLIADGATVTITDVNAELGRHIADEIAARFLVHDVTSERQWAAVMTKVESFGALHILVNNAGILGSAVSASPEATRLEDWRRVFAVNVEGVFIGCRTALPTMRRGGGGSIINLSSVAGLNATPYATAYGASKAAVAQLTRSVAQYCAERRLSIRCNSIHPGNVRTPLWETYARERALAERIPYEAVVAQEEADIPLGSFTSPQDIAAAASFLASDDARHITGAKIVVDGGLIGCDTFASSGMVTAGMPWV